MRRRTVVLILGLVGCSGTGSDGLSNNLNGSKGHADAAVDAGAIVSSADGSLDGETQVSDVDASAADDAGSVVEGADEAGADAGDDAGALTGCALGEPCCAANACESQLACLGAVCSCVADRTNDYLLRTDGVAFRTAINDTAQTVVVNADTGMPLHGIVSLMGSLYHGCAALDTGEVRCWPLAPDATGNNSGQLGNGTVGGTQAVLSASLVKQTADTDLSHVVAVGSYSATYYAPTTTCAVTTSGALYCWGSPDARVINGATAPSPFATQINTASGGQPLTAVTQVAVGYAHACVLSNGKVRCWGSNDGTGLTLAYPSADVVGIPGAIQQIAAGYALSCALTDANGGSVYCWGDNRGSAVGVGAPADVGYVVAQPARVRTGAATFLDGATTLSIAYGGACVLRTDHTVWCWGGSAGPFAAALKDTNGVDVQDAVKISTPFGAEAPRYLTDTGVLFSQGHPLTPNCAPQE